ncbi:hypothetical protein SAMN05421857_0210 [Chryseobacterium formosense]|nr:hypothetical protein [Chryseobacterium formosense]SFT34338.1 hypothetical protein SAMN05421857_0210 [Chryseobacterium formosense]
MKTFLKIDYYLQLTVFFGYLVIGILYQLIENNLFSVWFNFYFVVGGVQLVSYLLKVMIRFCTDLFIKIYGILILPIWIYLLLNKINFPLDLFSFIPVTGIFLSPIMAVAYLFYCREKSKDFLTTL